MYLCEDGHPEIVHDNGYRSCPLCEVLNTVEELKAEILELQEKIDDRDSKIGELQNEIEELKWANYSSSKRKLGQ